MTTGQVFELERQGPVLLISPTCNVSSLAEENVKPELDQLFAQLQSPEIKSVAIDFERVNYFGSSMLETLRRMWQQISERGGMMVICNVSEMEREVLHVTRFDTIWPVCGSREDALAKVL